MDTADSTNVSEKPAAKTQQDEPVGRFSRLWREGRPQDLQQFFSEAGELTQAQSAAILCIDQRERWQAGERILAEAYLGNDFGLTVDTDTAVDLVYQEFLLREELGETPAVEEYQERFPHLADELIKQIEFHRALAVTQTTAPVASQSDTNPAAEWPTIPGYVITGELGRGGMGVVYQARQLGLNRPVALKMILGRASGLEELARLHSEAESVAQLQHPHIVQIHQVGEHEANTYLVLEFVAGGSLAEKLQDVPLPSRQAAEIMEPVARAVHFAHQRGVVHRDLKPANILLTLEGIPKITDFGLAKRMEWGSHLTVAGSVLGTPSFMPPEQAAGRVDEIGPLVDVYALGATLYSLLTGRPPFQAASPTETLRQVIDNEPVAPRRLNAAVEKDAETICLKCLEKEPGRRYASAAELADDLDRYLKGLPIQARRATWREHALRWVRRNPGWAATLTTALALLLIVAVGGTILSVQLRQALTQARDAERDKSEKLWQSHLDRARAERVSGRIGQRFKALEAIRQAAKIRITQELKQEATAALILPDLEPAQEWEASPNDAVAIVYDGSLKRCARVNKQGEMTILQRTAHGQEEVLFRIPAHGQPVYSAPHFSPDGRFVFLGGGAGGTGSKMFRVWKLDTPAPTVVLDEKAGWHEYAVDFRPDSRQLAVGHADGSVSVYDLQSGRRIHRLTVDVAPMHVAFHPHRDWLAVAAGKAVRLFDLAGGRELPPLDHAKKVHYLAWHSDGKRLAAGCFGRTIHLWDADSARELMAPWTGHAVDGILLAFNHAGDRLLSRDWGRTFRLWNVATGQLLLTTPFCSHWQLGRDDRLLGWERTGPNLRLYRVAAGRELRVFHRREADKREQIFDPAVYADNRLLATCSGHSLSFFDLNSGEELASLRLSQEYAARPIGFVAQVGLLTGGRAGLLSWPVQVEPDRSHALRIGPPRHQTSVDPTFTNGATASRNGDVLAVPQGDFTLVFHRDRTQPLRLGPQYDVRWSHVSPDGRWVVTCSHWTDGRSKSARIWQAESGRHVLDLPLEGSTQAGFSPDGRWLATVTDGAGVRLWSVDGWREERRSEEADAFAFNSDGKLLALSDSSGMIRLLEVVTGREVGRLMGHEPLEYAPRCFTPDGIRLIATSSSMKALYVWDLRLIRQGLRELGLDWDWPPFPAPPPALDAGPLQIAIDAGHLAPAAPAAKARP